VNLAARLLDYCRADGVIVSEPAREFATRRLRKIGFHNERLVKVKGLSSKGSHLLNSACLARC